MTDRGTNSHPGASHPRGCAPDASPGESSRTKNQGPAGTGVKWYRRISVKLALALGLAMFSIQFLAATLIIETYRSNLGDVDITTRAASSPFARYLRDHLELDQQSRWVPTADAQEVIEAFLDQGETYVWLGPDDRVLVAGEDALDCTGIGAVWPLCDSPEYCDVRDDNDQVIAGSTWTRLAIRGRPIGTFVLVWFDYPRIASALSQRQVQVDLLYRLVASGVVAALTSLLLVSLVTRRLSRLAVDASAPLDEKVENIDLPGPFSTSGDDEIARLAVALNTMRGRIEDLVAHLGERDRQRREWIAQVSHDLRTPLTALSVCLERAAEKFTDTAKPVDRSAVIEVLTVARQDGQRLQTLVDDLFELARLDANEQLVLEPVPPGELVRQTVRGLGPMAEAKGIELLATVSPSLPIVRADGGRLMRALENLVRNALHFGRRRVQVVVACDGDHLKFEVLDDGPGLPEEDGKVILGQFDDQPRRPGSTGLGLIVTRRVATAHGGSVGGVNRPEGGAAVWMRIPIVAAH